MRIVSGKLSVELLQAGVPIERVSILLGQQSVRVTQKHYNEWALARQEQAESDVRRTWRESPETTKGMSKVRKKSGSLTGVKSAV